MLYWKFFKRVGFLSNLRLPWKPEFAVKFFQPGGGRPPRPPPRTPMHKIIDIGDFVRRSLYERDRITLLLNSWNPLSSCDLHLMLSAKALGMLVKSAHKNWKKRKKTSFAQRRLMPFLNFANMNEAWTWEICFPTVEKNHRSKQNSAETSS